MKKFQVVFDNHNGNRYSYFVKSVDSLHAIHIILERYISKMNLTFLNYEIDTFWK
jgi:hypothetical protein